MQLFLVLGEVTFRELTQYFDWIPLGLETESLKPYLNVSICE